MFTAIAAEYTHILPTLTWHMHQSKTYQPRIRYSVKLSFKGEGVIKTRDKIHLNKLKTTESIQNIFSAGNELN